MAKRKKSQKLSFSWKTDERENLEELSDSKLVALALKKIPPASQEIVRRYQKKLFAYLYHLVGNKEEVEDILQNVFIKVYGNLSHFDKSKKFSSWIYRIAHNEAVNILKKRGRRRLVSLEDISTSKDKLETSSSEKSPIDSWINKELKKEVQIAIDRLPSKYKEVLILRYFLDKSYEEMSEILGKPVNTVGTLLNRARKKLLQIIRASWK
ncbi:MAG: RNA polymerase sigma factor [Candidatus Moranbacteria bacterium]|nr:RNA polymerase sigma factor [Candidatus Moranbacteria bacterium]